MWFFPHYRPNLVVFTNFELIETIWNKSNFMFIDFIRVLFVIILRVCRYDLISYMYVYIMYCIIVYMGGMPVVGKGGCVRRS